MAARKRVAKASRKVLPRRKPTPRGVGASKPTPKPSGPPRASLEPALAVDRLEHARSLIREIPDFPEPGILFRDITPLLADPKGLHITLDALAENFVGEHIDAVVAIDARGFIFGGALAERLNASFVPVRKPGKLPAAIDSVTYALEYGTDELQMHRDALPKRARAIVVDDLLATGGTASAAGELVRKQGAVVAAYAFVIELAGLRGRTRLGNTPVVSLMVYD
jgi:adenine phosphoribosyltransferase